VRITKQHIQYLESLGQAIKVSKTSNMSWRPSCEYTYMILNSSTKTQDSQQPKHLYNVGI
jgi:hypothetical protein